MGVWSSMFYGGLEKATGRSIGGNLKGMGNENLWKELYGGKAHAKICGGARKHNYAWSSSDKQYEEKQKTTKTNNQHCCLHNFHAPKHIFRVVANSDEHNADGFWNTKPSTTNICEQQTQNKYMS